MMYLMTIPPTSTNTTPTTELTVAELITAIVFADCVSAASGEARGGEGGLSYTTDTLKMMYGSSTWRRTGSM